MLVDSMPTAFHAVFNVKIPREPAHSHCHFAQLPSAEEAIHHNYAYILKQRSEVTLPGRQNGPLQQKHTFKKTVYLNRKDKTIWACK